MSRCVKTHTVCLLFALVAVMACTQTALAANVATTTKITSPANGAGVTQGATINLTATVQETVKAADVPSSGSVAFTISGVAGTAATATATTPCVASGAGGKTQTCTYTTTFDTTSLSVGSHTFGASYSGGACSTDTCTASTATSTSFSVTALATPTIGVTGTGSSTLGQSATFTATVTETTAPAGTAKPLTGVVQFTDGSAVFGTASMGTTNNTTHQATATFSTALLGTGSHSITAVYIADTAAQAFFNNSAASANFAHTVSTRASATSVQAAGTVVVRSAAAVSATVTDSVNGASAGTYVADASTTPALTTARSGHTATRLPDGRVLVVGGNDGATAIASPEFYTSASGAGFGASSTAASFTARNGGTATLLQDGTVLLLGGSSTLVASGALASGEIYNPVVDSITPLGNSLNTARMNHSATLLADGRVLIIGGVNGSGTIDGTAGQNEVEIFDPVAGTFSIVTGNLINTRVGHSATLLITGSNAGAVLIAGGDTNGTAELYTIPADSSSTTGSSFATGSLVAKRSFHAARRLPDGTVLVSGGAVSGTSVSTSEIFDPTTDTFVLVGGPDWASGTYVAGAIITPSPANNNAGGYSYRCTTSGVSGGTAPATFNQTVGAMTMDGAVIWINIGVRTLDVARSQHAATPLDNGEVLLVGGLDGSNTKTASASDYTPGYDPQGALAFASDSGGGTGPNVDTVVGCTNLTLTGVGVVTCNGTVTPVHVNGSTTHQVTASYTDATASNHGGSSDAVGQALTVNKQSLALTAKPDTKTYDSSTSSALTPTINSGSLLSGDTAIQTFDTKFVGTGKTLTPTVVNGSSVDVSADYTGPFTTDTTGSITGVAITVTAATQSRAYDGTINSTATPTVTSGALASGDVGAFTQTFDTKHVGTGKTLTPIGTIKDSSNVDVSSNYTITFTAVTTGTITARAITVTAAADTKTYDKTNTSAAVPTVTTGTIAATEAGTFTQTFNDQFVAIGKTLTPTGTIKDASLADVTTDYAITFTPISTGVINAVAVTCSVTVNNKVYDGNNTAAIATQNLTGVLSGEVASCVGGTATFNNKNVGVAKAVSITGLSLTGADAGNYAVNATASTAADITARTLNVTAVANSANRTYDGGTTAPGQTLSDDRVSGDALTLGYSSAFTDKNVGTGKTVNITAISISGGVDQGNYTLGNTTTTSTANITARTLNVTANAGTANKVYDATTSATGQTLADNRVSGDLLTLSFTAAFTDKNVGAGKTVDVSAISITGGADLGNYVLGNTTASTTGNITAFAIVGTITANDKVYDGTTAAAIATRNLTGVFAGDVVSYTGGTATFSDKNVGAGKTVSAVGLGLTGTDAGNYAVNSTTSTAANITARTLNVSGVANSANKTYDGTTAAPGQTLTDDRVAGDVLTVTYTAAAFADQNVATGKAVSITGIAITGGTDQANYALGNTAASSTANIGTKAITAALTAANKVFDGTVTEPNANMSCAFTGILAGDAANVTCTPSSGAFPSKNVGSQTVSATVTIGGSAAGNYTLGAAGTTAASTTASATASITVRTLTLTATNQNKVVGTLLNLTPQSTLFTQSGLQTGDTLTSITVSSTGATAAAVAGSYPIVITALATGNFTGTLTLSNYTIVLVPGSLVVGSAPSAVALNVQASQGGATTYTFTANVTPLTPAIPTGTVTFSFAGGAAVTTVTVNLDSTGKATSAAIVLPAPTSGVSNYVVTAKYNGDANYVTSSQTAPVAIAASLISTPIVPGATATVTANLAYPGAGSPTITLSAASTVNPPPLNNVTCVVTSVLTTTLKPTCTVTATFPLTLSAGSPTAGLTIHITTATISASLHPTPLPAQHRFATLYAISMGMPAIVFMGLALPFGGKRRKGLRGRFTTWLGLALIAVLLFAAVGCGGGFDNAKNAQPVVTANASTPGTYTAILLYTDATGTHALASVDFAVGQ